MPNCIKASTITVFTCTLSCSPWICPVPERTVLPSAVTTRTYPHQEEARSPAQCCKVLSKCIQSCVLNAQGTKCSSTTRTIAGSAKIVPASLQPSQPSHSTKFAKIGFPVFCASARATCKSPRSPSGERFLYLMSPSSTACPSLKGDSRRACVLRSSTYSVAGEVGCSMAAEKRCLARADEKKPDAHEHSSISRFVSQARR
eukprot:TRINITY_DN75754_c0_g1_i1.p1 TRINITY_DN75754_c0_g1~~TRINITY_DN75754_c0_g1_i1.p1  ORF type:complete len:201 (-),score=15.75 TRINITY_DN75754_c0_g1_i1:141-743(-)